MTEKQIQAEISQCEQRIMFTMPPGSLIVVQHKASGLTDTQYLALLKTIVGQQIH